MVVPDPNKLAFRLFRNYYKGLEINDVRVSDFKRREFAFSYFGEDGVQRHVAFDSLSQLLEFLIDRVPRHAYHSTAYYRDPAAKMMDEKGWEGADLVFDVDVDHIHTPCKELHDTWSCRACGAKGWGAPPICPRCGSENLERHTWVCETCINVARDEILKLVDFLENDFGFSHDELFITFSGHRGFHVHVEAPEVRELDQDARREIVDFIKGIGLEIKQLLTKVKGGYRLRYPAHHWGWYGRLARWALLKTYSEDPILGLKEWEGILRECTAKEAVAIDEKVTIDTRRLIRLPNSLHGKTGLRVAPFSVYELESEKLLEKVKVFTNEEVVVELAMEPPRRVLDLELTPSTKKLPLYAALYMLLNGANFAKFTIV